MSTNHAYITSVGSYLPGPPVGNEEMEAVLGAVGDRPSRLRARILKSNGIQSRHYALDGDQRSTHQNSELAAQAARACLARSSVDLKGIDLLAVASTQGDLPLPGIASMVQAELEVPPCEILTTHGVCSAGVMALKAAVNQVRLGEKKAALVCAAELASRLLKASRYEATAADALDFEAEFLRWMLSDGAAAVTVEPKPRARGISLRVDWIEIVSYASDYDLCMSCGTADQGVWSNVKEEEEVHELALVGTKGNGATASDDRSARASRRARRSSTERSWQDYATYAEAEKDGALLIRQNLRILDNIVKVGVDGFLKLIDRGMISAGEVDHFICHYSSHYFRGKILELFKMMGCMIPEEKWFTNLYSKGNTGCAAMFIALDELFWSGQLHPGETVFCVVPESGRFTTAYIRMTVV